MTDKESTMPEVKLASAEKHMDCEIRWEPDHSRDQVKVVLISPDSYSYAFRTISEMKI